MSLFIASDDAEEEKKEADNNDAQRRRGSSSIISEQRASRLRGRRLRRQVGSTSCVRHETAASADDAAGETNQNDNKTNDSDVPDYTTAFTAISEKYSRHFKMERRSDDGMQQATNYQNCHRKGRISKRALAIKLIQKHWKSRINNGACNNSALLQRRCRQRINHGSSYHESNNDGSNDIMVGSNSVQPTLAFRRTSNIDYSSACEYRTIKFLNSQTIMAVDSYGYLDVVGLPLSSRLWEDRKDDENNDASVSSGGVGTHLARMPILSSTFNNNGPRLPLPRCHIEIYGYQHGEKCAVGLPSGQVQLFSSQRVVDSHGDSNKKSNNSTTTNPNDVWSCLPLNLTILGPRRRYVRNNEFSLSSMLSLDNKKEVLLEAFNDYETFEEIPNWVNETTLSVERSCTKFQGSARCLWSFREGGIGGGSGTALMGAYVDPELDCFSLRMLDERVCDDMSSANNIDATNSSSTSIFVDTSSHSAGKSTMSNQASDEVNSICFSGEFGLVTNHVLTSDGIRENIIKWWDHRMLRNQPVNARSLVFPMDHVHGVSSSLAYSLKGNCCDKGHCNADETCACQSVSLHPFDHGRKDSSPASSPEHCGSPQGNQQSPKVSNLVGSNDSSDIFAISLLNHRCRHKDILIVDSSRCQILRRSSILGDSSNNLASPCFSSNLDFVACHEKKTDITTHQEAHCISVFDISRHKSCSTDKNLHLSKGSKRGVEYLSRADEIESDSNGFLAKFHPAFSDVYGLESTLLCMAMDEFGCKIACGTNDGDIFIL